MNKDYETLLKELEEINNKLKNSDNSLKLEEAIELYEKGLLLAKKLEEVIENARLKVSKIQEENKKELNN